MCFSFVFLTLHISALGLLCGGSEPISVNNLNLNLNLKLIAEKRLIYSFGMALGKRRQSAFQWFPVLALLLWCILDSMCILKTHQNTSSGGKY